MQENRPWRFHPAKGLREKGRPYYHDIESEELDEEMFESREEFLEECKLLLERTLEREEEGTDERDVTTES